MTVKQFLNHYNIGRSEIKEATVIDTNEIDTLYKYSERELRQDAYGSRFGNMKVNSFTIMTDNIVIYAE